MWMCYDVLHARRTAVSSVSYNPCSFVSSASSVRHREHGSPVTMETWTWPNHLHTRVWITYLHQGYCSYMWSINEQSKFYYKRALRWNSRTLFVSSRFDPYRITAPWLHYRKKYVIRPIHKFVRSSECTLFSKLQQGKTHPSVKNITERKWNTCRWHICIQLALITADSQ